MSAPIAASKGLSGEAVAARAAEPPAKPWLTIKEFAEAAGISAMTVYRLINAGEFPAVQIGRRLFVPARLMEDLAAAAVASGRVVTAADWQEARE